MTYYEKISTIKNTANALEKELLKKDAKINDLENRLQGYVTDGKAYYIEECQEMMKKQIDEVYTGMTTLLNMDREVSFNPLHDVEVKKHNEQIDSIQQKVDFFYRRMMAIINGTYGMPGDSDE